MANGEEGVDDENVRLLNTCRETLGPFLLSVANSALETAMCQGELASLSWDTCGKKRLGVTSRILPPLYTSIELEA